MGLRPEPKAGLKLRFHIDLKRSEELLEARYKLWNHPLRPRKERLKDGDLALARYLLKIARASLRKDQTYKSIKPLEHLPFFRVTNPMLADEMGVVSKTIINRRKRLVDAGILVGYRYRTSGHPYDLRLATEVLWISHENTDENLSSWFLPQADAPIGSAAYSEKFSSLCNQLLKLGLKERKQLKKGVAQPPVDVDDEFIFACLPAELGLKTGNAPSASENQPDQQQENQETEGSAAAATPKNTPLLPKYDKNGVLSVAPKYWWQVTEHLTAAEERKLRLIVDKFWAKCAHWNWIGGGFLAKSQANLAKVRIAEWFTIRSHKIWEKLAGQYIGRLKLAEDTVKYRETQGKQSFFPPPGDYFNIRGTVKWSFRNTKERYNQRLSYKMSTAAKCQLTKAKNRIKIAGYSDNVYAVEVEWQNSLEKLEKYGQDIMDQFNNYAIEMYPDEYKP